MLHSRPTRYYLFILLALSFISVATLSYVDRNFDNYNIEEPALYEDPSQVKLKFKLISAVISKVHEAFEVSSAAF